MIRVNEIGIEIRTGYTVADLIVEYRDDKRFFSVPGSVGIIVVNGTVLGVYEKKNQVLYRGDVVQIIQPVGGG